MDKVKTNISEGAAEDVPRPPVRKALLLQVIVQPVVLVTVDGQPAQTLPLPQQVVMAIDWPSYRLPVEQLVQEIQNRLDVQQALTGG